MDEYSEPSKDPADLAEAGVLLVGDLLSTSTKVVGGNFFVFFAVTLLFSLPGWLLEMIPVFQALGNPFQEQSSVYGNVGGFVSFFCTSVSQGMLVFVTVEFMAGRKPTLAAAFSKAMSRLSGVLGVAILTGLLVALSCIPALIVAGAGSAALGGAALLCAFPFALGPALFVYLMFCLAVPAVVIEPGPARDALQRSAALTQGHRLTIFFTFLIAGMASLALLFVAISPFLVLSLGEVDPTTMVSESSVIMLLLGEVASLLAGVLISMFFSALITVIYARIVGIRDRVDAQALAAVFA